MIPATGSPTSHHEIVAEKLELLPLTAGVASRDFC